MLHPSQFASDGNRITHDGAAEIASAIQPDRCRLAWLSMVPPLLWCDAAALWLLLTRMGGCRVAMRLAMLGVWRLLQQLVRPYIYKNCKE